MITLAELKEHECALVISVHSPDEIKRHLADMGVVPGSIMTFKRKAPLGDPYLYKVMDCSLGIRRSVAESISAERI